MSVLGPALCPTPCETCDKQGLPILLARHAVVPAELPSTELAGHFKNSTLSGITLGAHAKYTQRLLRSGYVYVYDARYANQWDEYFVTGDGYLAKLPKRMVCSSLPPIPPTGTFACARAGARPMASVITIRNPKHASTLWLSFSDVQWTDDVMQQHNDASHRAKHMTQITVSGGKIAPQPNAEPLEKLTDLLPEYGGQLSGAMNQSLLASVSPFQFNQRDGEAQSLLLTYQQLSPQGGAAVVMLADPSGIVTEIAHLMEYRKVSFITRPEYRRPMQVSGAIVGIEYAIKEQAKLGEIAAGEILAERYEEGYATPISDGVPDPQTIDLDLAQQMRNITPAQLQKAADDTWHEYTYRNNGSKRFDDDARLQWRKQFDQAQQQFDQAYILPLAKAHVAWLNSATLQQCMACNFDPQDLNSGVVYRQAFMMMIEHTSDKQPCIDQYNLWLEQGDTENANLLMRALIYNQQQLEEPVKNAQSPSVDWRVLPNDAGFTVFKTVLLKLPENIQAQAGKFMDLLSGCIYRYLTQLQMGKVNLRAATALFGSHGLRMTRFPVKGNRGKFVQALLDELLRTSNKVATSNEIGKAVATQLRLLEIEGVDMKGTHSQQWFAALDKEVLRGIPEQASGEAWASAAAKAITRQEDLSKIDALAWRGMIGHEIGGGILTCLLQLANWTKLQSDWKDAMQQDKTDATVRLGAGIIAIGGTLTEMAGIALEKLPRFVPRMGAGVEWVGLTADGLKFTGRLVGLVGVIVAAVMDGVRAEEEKDKGNYGLARLYRASAFVGAALGVELYFVTAVLALPFGILLLVATLVAFLVITVMLEKNKDNKIQEWLSRCLWGSASDKYSDMVFEQQQLEAAFKG